MRQQCDKSMHCTPLNATKLLQIQELSSNTVILTHTPCTAASQWLKPQAERASPLKRTKAVQPASAGFPSQQGVSTLCCCHSAAQRELPKIFPTRPAPLEIASLPAVLTLHLLGAYRVELAGQPLTQFKTDKVRALLAYLAVESGRAHERSTLAGLLWPDMPEASALRNLTQTLVRLRQTIEDEAATPPFLRVTRSTLQFNLTSQTQVDVTDFVVTATRALQHGDQTELEQALARYGGELLPGFSLIDSAAYDEWLLLQREYLRRLAIEVAHTLVEAALRRGDYAKAETDAHRLLTFDPWRESAHRQLMRALVGSGQRAAALLHYERCRRLLLSELGVEPEAETVALYEQIRAGEHRPAAGPATSSPTPPVLIQNPKSKIQNRYNWSEAPDLGPFYGREAELATLTGWLTDDGCRVVALVGIGGVGKTALATQAIQCVVHGFELVIWRSLLNAPPLDEFLRGCLLTLSAQQLHELPPGLEAQLDLLVEYLHQQRCLLVLDNLESVLQGGEAAPHYRPGYAGYGQLLLRLGQTRHQSCLLLTSREEPPEFARLKVHEGQQGAARLFPVQGLTNVAAQTLLLEHGVAQGDSAALAQRYSGHPLALKLVADTIRTFYAGDVDAFLGEDAPIFADIRTVLDEQFGRLSPLEQEILFWLAIEREPVNLQTLQANLLQKPPRWTVLEAVRNLRRHSLLESHSDSFAPQNVVMEYVTERLVEEFGALLADFSLHGAQANSQKLHTSLLNRHALLQTSAKEYVRQCQVRLILQPIAQRLAQTLGEPGVQERFAQILQQLRSLPRRPGYAAGNLLNLLLTLGYGVGSYDFSQLCIWQASLRNAEATGVNFAQSDLTGSLFTDTFATVTDVAFSPDSALLAAGIADGTVRLWAAATGQPLRLLVGHTAVIWSIAFSPDGRWLASGGGDQAVRVWDVATGEPLYQLEGHTGDIKGVKFGQWCGGELLLASASRDHTVRVWSLPTGELRQVLRGHTASVSSVAISADGRQVISGSVDQSIIVWDLATGEALHTLTGHRNELSAVLLSPSGELLITASHDATIRIWETATWHTRQILEGHSAAVTRLAMSQDETLIVSCSYDKTVRIWDVQTGQPQRILTGHSSWVEGVALSADSRLIASGSGDQTVRVWDAKTGDALYVVSGYTNWVSAMAFRADGAALVSGHWDHTVRVWDLATGQVRHRLEGHTEWISDVTYSPAGDLLASAGVDPTVRLWDAKRGTLLHVLRGHLNMALSVAFSPDGTLLASGGDDHTARIWDIRTGRQLHRFEGHRRWVHDLAFSPEGAYLLTSGSDGLVLVWDLQGWQLVRTLVNVERRVSSLVFHPNGRWIAIGSFDQNVYMYDFHTGQQVHRLCGHGGIVRAVAFSPDGALLASGSDDRTIRLWEVSTGQLRREWKAHQIRTMTVAFHPDGTLLASGGGDELIKLWRVESGELVEQLHAPGPYAGMNITSVTGITEAQRAALRALGAVESEG
jgi:WD40 repeat protein/DNA-binding SARP family transcriptional activator